MLRCLIDMYSNGSFRTFGSAFNTKPWASWIHACKWMDVTNFLPVTSHSAACMLITMGFGAAADGDDCALLVAAALDCCGTCSASAAAADDDDDAVSGAGAAGYIV